MDNSKNLNESVIFPKGTQVMNGHFTGMAWVEKLVSNDSAISCQISNVTFEPGARNDWHKHPGGQILLVTGGKGYYQEEGKPAQVVKEGDVVKILPDVNHWHGAAPDSWFVHLSISPNLQKGEAEWTGPVTDEQYNNL